jgi:beta-phosphoglucomutase-like phosphatase (HAD superfamily)
MNLYFQVKREFFSEVFLDSHVRWCNIKALPGANRLIKHLKSNGVPMALASNSPRESIDAKISFHDGVDLFQKSQASCTFLSLFVIMKV